MRTPDAELLEYYQSPEFKSNVDLCKMKVKLLKLKIKEHRQYLAFAYLVKAYPEALAAGTLDINKVSELPMWFNPREFGTFRIQRKIQDQEKLIEDHIRGVVDEDTDSDDDYHPSDDEE